MEDCKIYGPGLANKLGEMRGKLGSERFDAKDWFSNGHGFQTEDAQLRKTLAHRAQDSPGQVRIFVARSKGCSAVGKWMEDRPELNGRARLCATPRIDVVGSVEFKDYLSQTRQGRREFYAELWGAA